MIWGGNVIAASKNGGRISRSNPYDMRGQRCLVCLIYCVIGLFESLWYEGATELDDLPWSFYGCLNPYDMRGQRTMVYWFVLYPGCLNPYDMRGQPWRNTSSFYEVPCLNPYDMRGQRGKFGLYAFRKNIVWSPMIRGCNSGNSGQEMGWALSNSNVPMIRGCNWKHCLLIVERSESKSNMPMIWGCNNFLSLSSLTNSLCQRATCRWYEAATLLFYVLQIEFLVEKQQANDMRLQQSYICTSGFLYCVKEQQPDDTRVSATRSLITNCRICYPLHLGQSYCNMRR